MCLNPSLNPCLNLQYWYSYAHVKSKVFAQSYRASLYYWFHRITGQFSLEGPWEVFGLTSWLKHSGLWGWPMLLRRFSSLVLKISNDEVVPVVSTLSPTPGFLKQGTEFQVYLEWKKTTIWEWWNGVKEFIITIIISYLLKYDLLTYCKIETCF